ncbi:hypothetical protein [Amycolatopsis sp. Hca4]|uniref:hypothetical protein n=1 Tax=Amycolatopsis sp. Hca4 TaxID=2742131 RepID=UPI001591891C|nr:hypothetical protein [Amycolatopsis sp. Hca4]QKV73349.1 hypothetical protein HUT10_05785 [Amycolatopsis sp. Hca4]
MAVLEIIDDDGEAEALQIALLDGTSVVCTVWTDWSLRVERRPDTELPDYLWPVDAYSRRPIVPDIPEGGLEVRSLVTSADEAGTPVAADLELDGYRISARSWGGRIVLSVVSRP